MKPVEFSNYWNKHYPESYLIGHDLKWVYPDRWIRIHSLPQSKRYASTEDEYQIILDRQNQLIDDLVGKGTEFAISFRLFRDDASNSNYEELEDFVLFEKVQTIDFQKEQPDVYDAESLCDFFVLMDKWERNSRNEILKAVADDEIRVLFVCPSKACIIAPYDGGVDIIVDSTKQRDRLREKYKDWLSSREDGM